VSHTVVKLAQSRIEKDRTKNKASNRTLPLLANVKEYLLALETQQARDKATFGSEYHDTTPTTSAVGLTGGPWSLII